MIIKTCDNIKELQVFNCDVSSHSEHELGSKQIKLHRTIVLLYLNVAATLIVSDKQGILMQHLFTAKKIATNAEKAARFMLTMREQ